MRITRHSPGGSAFAALAILVGIVVAGCGGAAATPVPVPPGAVVLTAKDSTFAPADITGPSGASASGFQLYFDNADATPHDVVFVAADGTRLFQSDTYTGPQQRVYNVKALPAGEYKLVCDIHPEMHGTLTVP